MRDWCTRQRARAAGSAATGESSSASNGRPLRLESISTRRRACLARGQGPLSAPPQANAKVAITLAPSARARQGSPARSQRPNRASTTKAAGKASAGQSTAAARSQINAAQAAVKAARRRRAARFMIKP
jgi:hypothetical protein